MPILLYLRVRMILIPGAYPRGYAGANYTCIIASVSIGCAKKQLGVYTYCAGSIFMI